MSSDGAFGGSVDEGAAEYKYAFSTDDDPIFVDRERDGAAEAHTPQATAALHPTALAHFLSLLLRFPNCPQALMEFAMNRAPDHHNDDHVLPADPVGDVSIAEGLDHITAELGAEFPNILANDRITEPETKVSPETLQYL